MNDRFRVPNRLSKKIDTALGRGGGIISLKKGYARQVDNANTVSAAARQFGNLGVRARGDDLHRPFMEPRGSETRFLTFDLSFSLSPWDPGRCRPKSSVSRKGGSLRITHLSGLPSVSSSFPGEPYAPLEPACFW